jgi:hypothetical protein
MANADFSRAAGAWSMHRDQSFQQLPKNYFGTWARHFVRTFMKGKIIYEKSKHYTDNESAGASLRASGHCRMR